MDTRWELRKVRWLFAGVKLFLLGLCLSHAECTYALHGRDGVATVTRTTADRTRWGGRRRTVEYEFTEPDGRRRRDNDVVSADWPLPPDGTVAIRYTPGLTGGSRLAGNVSWFGLGIFFGSLLLVAVGIVVLGRDGRDRDKWR